MKKTDRLSCLRAGLAIALLGASPVLLAAGAPLVSPALPDTGQTTCYDDTAADSVGAADATSITRDTGSHPRQDCRYGNDSAAAAGQVAKGGGGAAGFDYSKVANDGTLLTAGAVLGSGATDWACTRDNRTGLTWEVKVNNASHLRHMGWAYTWYSGDAATNGGNAGHADTGAGAGSDNCLDNARCDTGKYVADVNAATLCGSSDWRLPGVRELETLLHFGAWNPAIADSYFPNTQASGFWSISSFATTPANALVVRFEHGDVHGAVKSSVVFVRLVRGGQF